MSAPAVFCWGTPTTTNGRSSRRCRATAGAATTRVRARTGTAAAAVRRVGRAVAWRARRDGRAVLLPRPRVGQQRRIGRIGRGAVDDTAQRGVPARARLARACVGDAEPLAAGHGRSPRGPRAAGALFRPRTRPRRTRLQRRRPPGAPRARLPRGDDAGRGAAAAARAARGAAGVRPPRA